MSDSLNAQSISRAVILGAGTMGNGIAQVCAQAGIEVVLFDINDDAVATGLANIKRMLAKAVEKGKASPEDVTATMSRLSTSTDLIASCEGAQLVVEAIPEKLELSNRLWHKLKVLSPTIV